MRIYANLHAPCRSVPNAASALAASRQYATHPHLASSQEDFEDSKVILKLFQDEFGIHSPHSEPIFSAGTEESQRATRGINKLKGPSAWIDTYYPILNTPLERELQIIGDDGTVIWNADVEEVEVEGDEAGKFAKTIGAWHGLSKAGDVTVWITDS